MLAKQLAWMATKDNNLGNPFRVTLSCFLFFCYDWFVFERAVKKGHQRV